VSEELIEGLSAVGTLVDTGEKRESEIDDEVPSEVGVLSRFPRDGDGFTAYLPDSLCCTVIGGTQLL
jgi:hypothetical protein